ncbi:VOC family protein [Roseateles chitosanitabidus]|uniref:VOC family protein n=1 Tax=Roseateles chitosanitabidus TaxID=65048 RepID=UPI001FE223BF|nr:VOC family protein [Roseateles chitosanitabidus]
MTTNPSAQAIPSTDLARASATTSSGFPRTTLNHMSLPTHDVPGTVAFFEHYLDAKTLPFGTSCVVKKDGWDIVIEDARDRDVAWPGNFHIGVELATRAELEQLYAAMVADQVPMQTPLIEHVRGSRFFCWLPGDVMLEVNTREDAQAPYKATFASQQG